ncbi:hypothetical protein ACFSKW_46570 [Nonomuraea mangrovi]|uniref:Uncharacterized protein n=1 Tax=Nonomuraea mangrovi TaxID=2316207 RepID=A0ABW4TDB7_9ACTN
MALDASLTPIIFGKISVFDSNLLHSSLIRLCGHTGKVNLGQPMVRLENQAIAWLNQSL